MYTKGSFSHNAAKLEKEVSTPSSILHFSLYFCFTSLQIAIIPLLTKPNLNVAVLSNYRPISHLRFIRYWKGLSLAKLLFMNQNTIPEKFQSGLRANHSTETALTEAVSDLRINIDADKVSTLVLQDVSAAFNTTDHSIHIERLQSLIGLAGSILNWFRSYTSRRKFREV